MRGWGDCSRRMLVFRRAKTAILHNFLSVRARTPSCGQFAQFEKAAKCQSSGEDDPTGRYKLVLASLRGLVVQCSTNNGSVVGMQGRVGGQGPWDAEKFLVMGDWGSPIGGVFSDSTRIRQLVYAGSRHGSRGGRRYELEAWVIPGESAKDAPLTHKMRGRMAGCEDARGVGGRRLFKGRGIRVASVGAGCIDRACQLEIEFRL